MFERITPDQVPEQFGHIYRYVLASGYMKPGETVLDVACGIGYGAQILKDRADIAYIGADKIEPADQFRKLGDFHTGIDLAVWQPKLTWDVSVSFETLEHLENPEQLANILKQAKRLIILSTPTRPTKHFNPYHLQDFTVDDILTMFSDWELLHLEDQPEELSHIFVFGRHHDS